MVCISLLFSSPFCAFIICATKLKPTEIPWLQAVRWEQLQNLKWFHHGHWKQRPGALNSSRPNPQPFPLGTDQGCRQLTGAWTVLKLPGLHKAFGDKLMHLKTHISYRFWCVHSEKNFPGAQKTLKWYDARNVNHNKCDLGWYSSGTAYFSFKNKSI